MDIEQLKQMGCPVDGALPTGTYETFIVDCITVPRTIHSPLHFNLIFEVLNGEYAGFQFTHETWPNGEGAPHSVQWLRAFNINAFASPKLVGQRVTVYRDDQLRRKHGKYLPSIQILRCPQYRNHRWALPPIDGKHTSTIIGFEPIERMRPGRRQPIITIAYDITFKLNDIPCEGYELNYRREIRKQPEEDLAAWFVPFGICHFDRVKPKDMMGWHPTIRAIYPESLTPQDHSPAVEIRGVLRPKQGTYYCDPQDPLCQHDY